jgi:hypothetical protein
VEYGVYVPETQCVTGLVDLEENKCLRDVATILIKFEIDQEFELVIDLCLTPSVVVFQLYRGTMKSYKFISTSSRLKTHLLKKKNCVICTNKRNIKPIKGYI